MKKSVVLVLGSLALSASALAAGPGQPLEKACVKKIVAAVNKHHTLAEGAVYAVRQIYNGQFASTVLVGHSDETDPTDYLVTVDTSKAGKKACAVQSIIYTNEASDVETYSAAERIGNL